MAVFSKDQITGKVVINARAEENNIIVNYPNSSIGTIKLCRVNTFKIDSNITKINKYSIKAKNFDIFPKNMETLFKSDKDFTWCFWEYTGGYGFDFFAGLSNSRTTDKTWGEMRYTEMNSNEQNQTAVELNGAINESKIIGSATYGEWIHHAITKKDSTIYFFKNGKTVYSTSISDDKKSAFFDSDGGTLFSLGVLNDRGECYFYLDDFVFISGQCLWTSDYNIPTEPILGYEGKHQEIYPKILDISSNNKVFLNYY